MTQRKPHHALIALAELVGAKEVARQLVKRGVPDDDARWAARAAAALADPDWRAVAEQEPMDEEACDAAANYILSSAWLHDGDLTPSSCSGILA